MRSKSLFQKLLISNVIFMLFLVTLLVMTVRAKNVPIESATLETQGVAYQMPLETLLQDLIAHRTHLQRALKGDHPSAAKLKEVAQKVDADFDNLENVDRSLGTSLQVTDQGLAQRKRDHVRLTNVRGEWKNLHDRAADLKPEEILERHVHLISDIRTLITHIGDTSGLILDPDLDSYYLVDASLAAYPEMQDRIQEAGGYVWTLLKDGAALTPADRVKISTYAAMIKQANLDRITGDVQTALNEDKDFYELSPTLQQRVPPATQDVAGAVGAFVEALEHMAGEAKLTMAADHFAEITDKAQEASFKSWFATEQELDTLLHNRIESLRAGQIWAGVLSLLALISYAVFAYLFSRSLTRTLVSVIERLERSSVEMDAASTHSAATASVLSESSVGQASSLQETMASAEEIAAMVDQNAESAAKAKEVVEQNATATTEGSRNVAEMLVSISDIKATNDQILDQMESSNKEFSNIVKIISEIGDKTKVINDIVFQTKLLSFNASVEAARAGEHGKGFAVVAEEVGNLAQMSGNAAKEITDMLENSIRKVNEIVDETTKRVDELVEIGKDKISMGESTAQKCRQALERVAANAVTVTQMVTEISNASREQSQGVQEINKAIALLDQTTQKNSVVAQQSASQSAQMRAEASNLSNTVDELQRFVKGAAAVAAATAAAPSRPASKRREGKTAPAGPAQPAGRVLPFEKGQPAKSRAARAPMKKVVGGEAIPSSDDPNFEEF